ncbi:hypothetical protein GCK32_010479 [Trichostrongylus colubriformis]|uniref:SEA domain-containing protein n=1 Tax=Trichostrongylus colubriformis TaxID=6319 RepID=A0AAN8INC5_TRICO
MLAFQPTSEPVFPRVELPEESAEIVNEKKTTTTDSFMVDAKPVSVVKEIQDTTPTPSRMPSTRPLPSIVIQPIVTKTTVNEFHVQPNMDSEEARRLATIIQGSTGAMPSSSLKKAMFTMRITSIEFMEEFADKASGKYKKLSDQIVPQMSAILKTILGDNFVDFEIRSLAKGLKQQSHQMVR